MLNLNIEPDLSGWFGMRTDVCIFLLDTCPCLQQYGNVSYKFGSRRQSIDDQPDNNGGSGRAQVTDWLIFTDWMTDWMTLIYWMRCVMRILRDWLTLIHWLDFLNHWMTDWLTAGLTDFLHWLILLLTVWLIDICRCVPTRSRWHFHISLGVHPKTSSRWWSSRRLKHPTDCLAYDWYFWVTDFQNWCILYIW